MSTERFKNVTSFVINLLNNKTIILLNLAEYRVKGVSFQRLGCGAASVGVLQDNLVLSTELIM